jgi:hypothetical protein
VAFAETFTQVRDVVQRVFPQAEAIEEWGMRGWKVPLVHLPESLKGTFDMTHLYVLLADRKAGPTLHIWYPGIYHWLDEHKAELAAAGFKVMRGCLPYSRRQPYPIDVVERLLRRIKL